MRVFIWDWIGIVYFFIVCSYFVCLAHAANQCCFHFILLQFYLEKRLVTAVHFVTDFLYSFLTYVFIFRLRIVRQIQMQFWLKLEKFVLMN